MLLVPGLYQIIQPGVWKQTIEIQNDGHIIGFVDRKRTQTGILTKTRNMQGNVIEYGCLEWLLRQTA